MESAFLRAWEHAGYRAGFLLRAWAPQGMAQAFVQEMSWRMFLSLFLPWEQVFPPLSGGRQNPNQELNSAHMKTPQLCPESLVAGAQM